MATSPSSEKEIVLESPYDISLLQLPAEQTVPEYLLNRAAHFQFLEGRKEWITNTVDGETFNFGDLDPLSSKIASGLYKKGLGKSDVVLFTSHDGVKAFLFWIGVWRANGQIRLSYAEDDVETQVERILESKIRFYVCDFSTYDNAQLAVSKIPWPVQLIVFGPKDHPKFDQENVTSFYDLLDDDGASCPSMNISEDDISFIMATSGTTGTSKGAYFTHRMTLENFLPYERHPFTDDPLSGALVISKTTHFIGSHIPLTCLSTGKRLLTIHPVTTENILKAIDRYKPRGIYAFPKFLLDLLDDPEAPNYDLSSIQIALTAGTVVGPTVRLKIAQLPSVRQVLVFYGMTECGFFASNLDFQDPSSSRLLDDMPSSSVGKLGPDTRLRVVEVDTGKSLGPNELGELSFETKRVCAGYLNKPEETAKTFPNGWILTGDLGFFDENGFIFVVDRIKEVFKCDNNQIAPSELEDVISSHEQVSNVHVIGVPDPGSSQGFDYIPKAFVTLHNSSDTTAEEIVEYANSKLAPYKQFRSADYMIILQEFPLGKTGKVSKAMLAQL